MIMRGSLDLRRILRFRSTLLRMLRGGTQVTLAGKTTLHEFSPNTNIKFLWLSILEER
jgi:hypothetical protein